ncbi:DUF7837 family putative zinc-binding protein [Haloferax denitrificans]
MEVRGASIPKHQSIIEVEDSNGSTDVFAEFDSCDKVVRPE